jgi:hypothetical protein
MAELRAFKVCFSVDPESFEGRMLQIAAQHYTGGAAVLLDQGINLVAKQVVSQWLQERVDFPTLAMGSASYPLKRVEARLTKLE